MERQEDSRQMNEKGRKPLRAAFLELTDVGGRAQAITIMSRRPGMRSRLRLIVPAVGIWDSLR